MRRTDDLAAAYAHCRSITRHHGRSYSLAAMFLPADRRPHVYALYAFARSIDDLVDEPDPGTDSAELDRKLVTIDAAVRRRLSASGSGLGPYAGAAAEKAAGGRSGYRRRAEPNGAHLLGDTAALPHLDPRVSAPFLHTARTLRLAPSLFGAFLRSMRMDIPDAPGHVRRFATMGQLDEYMHGSAEVIGLQMLPVLGAPPEAAPYAQALGSAFQMTNFLRDVGEDLDRGRIYLPRADLAASGADEDMLVRARHTGEPDPPVREALAHFTDRTRERYRAAEPGAALLPPRPAACVRAATAVYSEILTEIERGGYRVFDRRTVVPRSRRYRLAVHAAAHMRAR